MSHIQSGTVKAVAILGPDRVSALPDLPTAKERGLPALDWNAWAALVLPKGAPDAIVNTAMKTRTPITATNNGRLTMPELLQTRIRMIFRITMYPIISNMIATAISTEPSGSWPKNKNAASHHPL